jgi:hypothetical protein
MRKLFIVMFVAWTGLLVVAAMRADATVQGNPATLHNTTAGVDCSGADTGQVGWVFVDPHGDFVSPVIATFGDGHVVTGSILANPKFSVVDHPLSDTLVSGTATVTDQDGTFNLTHVCAADVTTTTEVTSSSTTVVTVPPTSTTSTFLESTSTSTVPDPTTTSTVPDTTSTVPETSTTLPVTSTSLPVASTTTLGSTVTSVPPATQKPSKPSAAPVKPVPPTSLAYTGSGADWMVLFAGWCIGLGITLWLCRPRKRV